MFGGCWREVMGLGWVELQDKIWGMVSSDVGTRFSVSLIYRHV